MYAGAIKKATALSLILSVALASGVVVATRSHGIALTPDSVSYASAAESFADRGVVRIPVTTWDSLATEMPMRQHAPFLAVLLGSIAFTLGGEPREIAPWLNALLLAATAFLLFTLAPATIAGRLAVLALLVSPAFYAPHLALWSEPLFLFLCAVQLALWRWVPPRARWLPWALGVLTGLAVLTRYVGLFLVPAMTALILLEQDEPLRARLRRCLAFVLGAVAVAGPWMAWYFFLAERVHVTRALTSFPEQLRRQLPDTLTLWFLPERLPLAVRVVLLAVVVGAVAVRGARGPGRMERAALVFAAGYLGFVIAARALTRIPVPFDDRMLAPLAMFVAVYFCAGLAATAPSGIATWIAIAAALWIAALGLRKTNPIAWRVAEVGAISLPRTGYSSEPWRSSPTIAWLRALPPGVTLFSNLPDAVAVLVRRPVKWTPLAKDRARLPEFVSRLEATAPSVLVLFEDEFPWRDLVRNQELVAALGLRETLRFRDARLFVFRQR